MKVPIQAPPVVREAYRWQSAPIHNRAGSPPGVGLSDHSCVCASSSTETCTPHSQTITCPDGVGCHCDSFGCCICDSKKKS